MQRQSELLFAITQHTVIIYLQCPPFISFVVLFGYSGRLFQQLCVGHGGTTVHLHMLRRTNEQLNSPPTLQENCLNQQSKVCLSFIVLFPSLHPSPTLPPSPYSLSFFSPLVFSNNPEGHHVKCLHFHLHIKHSWLSVPALS